MSRKHNEKIEERFRRIQREKMEQDRNKYAKDWRPTQEMANERR